MMSTFECFQRAAKCTRLAEISDIEANKAQFLAMARHWRTLADKIVAGEAFNFEPSAGPCGDDALNVFIAEGNIEIYLSKLHGIFDPTECDQIRHLMAKEFAGMGFSRVHQEGGVRRVMAGRQRLEKQRFVVAGPPLNELAAQQDALLLEMLKRTQKLLEEQPRLLRKRQ